jgi:hypothetical protein
MVSLMCAYVVMVAFWTLAVSSARSRLRRRGSAREVSVDPGFRLKKTRKLNAVEKLE